MAPYVSLVDISLTLTIDQMETCFSFKGQQARYEIVLVEPQTPWRYKARELIK
jgi:hypothetical protein